MYTKKRAIKSYTEWKVKHKPSGYSWYLICLFDKTKNYHNFYRGKDCIEKLCKDVKELAIAISSYREQEMILLTDKEINFCERQKVCHICKNKFCTNENNKNEFKLNKKVRDHCQYAGKFRGAALNICNLRYKIAKEIRLVFHNGSTYDYHFIIKRLAEEFQGQFECLGENTEKFITFSVPIKKEHDNGITSTYKLKLIDSYTFMQSKLSDLIHNLSGTFNKEWKSYMERKQVKSECDFIGLRNNRLNYKCKKMRRKMY